MRTKYFKIENIKYNIIQNTKFDKKSLAKIKIVAQNIIVLIQTETKLFL